MGSVRHPLQRLQAAGHLDGATESLLAALADRVATQDELAHLAQVREDMLRALGPMAGGHSLAARIHAAPDLQALWSLRDPLSDLVAAHHPADRSRHLLRTIAARFVAGR